MTSRTDPTLVQKMTDMRADGMTVTAIAKELKLHRSTVSKYLNNYGNCAGRVGPPIADKVGEVIDRSDIDGSLEITTLDRFLKPSELAELAGLDPQMWISQFCTTNTWQQGFKTEDGGAGKQQLYQSKATFKRVIEEEIARAVIAFMEKAIVPLPRPKLKGRVIPEQPQMASWGIWDAHVGMYAWREEVGKDFDLKTAENRVMNAIDDMADELAKYPITRIVMPTGNDFMHFDSVRMTTTHGDHFLDSDSRYAKVYEVGLRCLIYMVHRALEICDQVEVLYVPGNHDYTSSFTLCSAINQRFINDPRVTVDLRATPRKYITHGSTLIGFDHGKIRPDQLAKIFATETRQHWSDATWCEMQVGHTHQGAGKMYSTISPVNGILVRTHPALCNTDAWHHGMGFTGNEPAAEAHRYDEYGFKGSHCVRARDERG